MTAAPAPPLAESRPGTLEARVCAFGAVLAMALAAAVIGRAGRGWFFFYDEWGIVTYRRTGGAAAFLAPHNGHLQVTVIAIYRLLFDTVGLRHYGPYRAVEVLLHLLCGGLLFLYAARRLRPVAALLLALLFLFLGAGWEVMLWPVNAGFVLPLVAYLACLLVWDLVPRWEPAATAGLAVLAVASSGLGLAVLAGLGIEAAARRHLRRILELGAVGVAWLAWFAVYRPSALPPAGLRSVPGASPRGDVGSVGFTAGNVGRLPGWILRSARATLEGVAGTTRADVAYLLGAGVLAVVVSAVARKRFHPRQLGVATAMAAFWGLTGLARSGVQLPQVSRYIYPGALLLLVLLADLLPRGRWPTPATALAAAGVALALAGGLHILNRAGDGATRAFPGERADLARIEACRGRVPPGTLIDPRMAPGLTAGPFWAATTQLGQPVVPARGPKDPCRGRPVASL